LNQAFIIFFSYCTTFAFDFLSPCKNTGTLTIKAYKALLFVVLINITIYVSGQNSHVVSVKITPWYQNKPGAVSISFDDASYSQYTSAYPILEKYHLKGTFSMVGEWVDEQPGYTAEPGFFEIKRMGWEQLLELYNHGHELAAHGYNHQKYDKQLPVSELVVEMKKIKTLIESRTNSPVFTLNYPYSYASGNIPEAAREAGYLFGRTGLDTINPPAPENMYLLASMAVLNSDQPDSSEFQDWINQSKGNWLILMYHHLFPLESKEMDIIRSHHVEYSYSLLPEDFENQIKALAASGYWIAPISEIGRYIAERDSTVLRTIILKKKVYVYTDTDLDKNIYNLPLTLEIIVPWKKVKIEGSLSDGIFQTQDNKLLISVLPESQLILSKE
jgi:hypothetical protein